MKKKTLYLGRTTVDTATQIRQLLKASAGLEALVRMAVDDEALWARLDSDTQEDVLNKVEQIVRNAMDAVEEIVRKLG